jgi:hypothetical protein
MFIKKYWYLYMFQLEERKPTSNTSINKTQQINFSININFWICCWNFVKQPECENQNPPDQFSFCLIQNWLKTEAKIFSPTSLVPMLINNANSNHWPIQSYHLCIIQKSKQQKNRHLFNIANIAMSLGTDTKYKTVASWINPPF